MNLVVESAVRGIKLEEAFVLKIIDGFLASIDGSVVDFVHGVDIYGRRTIASPKALYAA